MLLGVSVAKAACQSLLRPEFTNLELQGVTGELAILLRRPAETLARQALALERSIGEMAVRIDAGRTSAQRRPERAQALAHVRQALEVNVKWLIQLRDLVLPILSPKALLAAGSQPERRVSSYPAERLFTLLRRDWSGACECENEVQSLLQALRSTMPASMGRRSTRILMLGAGLGRLADELAGEYSEVHSIELSLPLALTAALLRQSSIAAYDVRTRHARNVDDQAKAFVATRPHRLSAATSRITVADATDLPFVNGFADVVISAYFTDVVPPRKLLSEVRRVLRPGGRFIHLGPLGYHFDDTDDHLSAEELLTEVAAHGFVVSAPRWVTTTHECEARSIHECRFHNLLFSADAIWGPVFMPYELPRPPFI